jgi:hypothetical protein
MAVPLLLAILLSVTLTPPFGEAEARALTVTGAITIDVSVEVEGTPTTVIARITGLAGELPPQALVERGGGIWGTIIRLTGIDPLLLAGVAAALGALVLFGFWAGSGIKESVKPTDWTYGSTDAAREAGDDDDDDPVESSSEAEDGEPADDDDEA